MDMGDIFVGEMSFGVENFFSLLKVFNYQEVYNSLMEDYNKGELKYVDLKQVVVDVLVFVSVLIRVKKQELFSNKKEVKNQIKVFFVEI